MNPDYGIDAPILVRASSLLCMLSFAVWILLTLTTSISPLITTARILSFGVGAWSFVFAAVFYWSSKVGKLRVRDRVINAVPWHGDEMVLDVGCGRGLMLIAASKRVRAGKAVGVDIWRSIDQSGNRPESTMRNVEIEGVADRVEVKNGDARQLPFPDSTFDVVLSSLAIHNIHGAEYRRKAIAEMVRVVKPGGRLVLVDLLRTREYVKSLVDNGMRHVERSRVSFLFFMPVHAVTATKPLR